MHRLAFMQRDILRRDILQRYPLLPLCRRKPISSRGLAFDVHMQEIQKHGGSFLRSPGLPARWRVINVLHTKFTRVRDKNRLRGNTGTSVLLRRRCTVDDSLPSIRLRFGERQGRDTAQPPTFSGEALRNEHPDPGLKRPSSLAALFLHFFHVVWAATALTDTL